MPKPVNKAYTMSLHAAPTPVTNPYQRPLLSVRWMQRMPTGPIGAEARTPMTIPLKMKSRMFISIGNAKFILVSLQFLTGGKVTKFRAQSTIFSLKSSFYSRFLYFRARITRITRMFQLIINKVYAHTRSFCQQSVYRKKSENYIFLYIKRREIQKFSVSLPRNKNNSN